jgi:hypothetical protein
MKNLTTLLLGLAISASSFSQSVSTGVTFNKSTQPALMLLLPYTESVAEGTILQKLRETGYDPETKGKLFWKQNKVNGFYIFKGVVLKEIDKQPLDLYFKIESRGRKENEKAVIYLLVSKGEEKFITPEDDDKTHAAAKRFLNRFVDESAAYKLNKEIEAQEDVIKDAEKKFTRLQEAEKDLLKKIAALQEEMNNNKLQQENQKKVVDNEKIKLTELKEKASKQ